MQQILETLSRPEVFVAALVGVCVLVGMTLRAITTMVTSFSRERTRREIAAYIAESSMTPEQGERLLKADLRRSA
jgi:Flp pilus assembly protein TadD